MGCCASEPEDPCAALRERINAVRGSNLARADDIFVKQREIRYVKSVLEKINAVNAYLDIEMPNIQGYYESLLHIICDKDADLIFEASDGMGTDEELMGKVVMRQTHEMLKLTDVKYQEKYGKTLEDQIRGENKSFAGLLTGSLTDFGRFLTYRSMLPADRDAFLIHKCMSGFGCSDYTLIEILSTMTMDESREVAAKYAEEQDGESMVERIMSETGGLGKKWYGKWMDELVKFERDERPGVYSVLDKEVDEIADILFKAGENTWMGCCDEQPFIDYLIPANEDTCAAICAAYERHEETKKSLEQAVRDKMGGDLEFACVARVLRKHEFLAARIYGACKGIGTDEECIARVLARATKDDAKKIENAYNERYKEESGNFADFKALLNSELNGNFLEAIMHFLDEPPAMNNIREPEALEKEAGEQANDWVQGLIDSYGVDIVSNMGGSDMDGRLILHGIPPEDVFVMLQPLGEIAVPASTPVPDKMSDTMRANENYTRDPNAIEDEGALSELADKLVKEEDDLEKKMQQSQLEFERNQQEMWEKLLLFKERDWNLKFKTEGAHAMREYCENNGLEGMPDYEQTPTGGIQVEAPEEEKAPPPMPATGLVYDSPFKFVHELTGRKLHSHEHNYEHDGTTGQQQVTCFDGDDANDLWIVRGPHGEDTPEGEVPADAVVRLTHRETGRNLHSHGAPSPCSGQQEVTCFGEGDGEGDANDNWQVIVLDESKVKFVHCNTGHRLHSHQIDLPDWGFGQGEVTCFGGEDDNDNWLVVPE